MRDRHGREVRDLEPADLTLTVDGTPAAIRHLRLVEGRAVETAPLVSLVFDRTRGEPQRLAEEAADKLLSSSAPDTLFSVWLIDEKLVLLQSFTSDRPAVKAAIRAVRAKKPPPAAPQGAWANLTDATLATSERLMHESPFGLKIAALIALAGEQRSITRRKALVYFSEGLPISGSVSDEGALNIISAATQANVTLFTVDLNSLAATREEEASRSIAISSLRSTAQQEMRTTDPRTQSTGTQDRIAVGNLESDVRQTPKDPLHALAEKTGGFSVSKTNDVRWPMARIARDLGAYYEISYNRPHDFSDGRYHSISLMVRRKGVTVSYPAGFYTAPETATGVSLPFELPLLEALAKAPVTDLPVTIRTWHFRSSDPTRTLISFWVEVDAADVHLQEDESAGMVRSHLAALVRVRDSSGRIALRFGADRPLQTPLALHDEARRSPFVMQKDFALVPGQYTIEIAVRDQLSERVHAETLALSIAPSSPGLSLSGLALVEEVRAAPGPPSDTAFALPSKAVLPSLNNVVTGGRGARATLFFRLHRQPGVLPVDLSVELWNGDRQYLKKQLRLAGSAEDPSAQVVSLDLASLPAGQYQFRVNAEQAGLRASDSLSLKVIEAAPTTAAGTAKDGGEAITLQPASELAAVPLTVEHQHILDRVRVAALSYSQRLPNFLCTEVTRRLLDDSGKDEWRKIDESTQLVTFYDGREHYQRLLDRDDTSNFSRVPFLNSAGEFGTLLRSIFAPEAATLFLWVRSDSIGGRAVQVFSYRVEVAHSKNRVSYSAGTALRSAIIGFHGLLFVDPDTAMVLRINEEADALPTGLPVRGLSLTLEYGDISVGNQLYLLPLSFTLDIRLRRRTLARNEVTFRSYQRFSVESRVVPR